MGLGRVIDENVAPDAGQAPMSWRGWSQISRSKQPAPIGALR
jgi:hypothetical protein